MAEPPDAVCAIDPAQPKSPEAVAAGEFAWRLGRASILGVGIVLVAWALSVDLPRTTGGFFSDGATYYSFAHSLAEDFDFEYRRDDLVRVWREFRGGPEGIFLKRGRDVRGVSFIASPPFFRLDTVEDWDANRLYYGKAFIYPLFAAPFVRLFGTNGFLVLHALLMTACFACAYGFLIARSGAVPSLIFALVFLFVSVVPVYMVQLMPDFFNLALVLIGYFFWCYKEVIAESVTACIGRWRARWVMSARSDVMAAVLLGMATFSKPIPHVLFIVPILALCAIRRQWLRGLLLGSVFAGVVAGFFAWNVAITGDWNYQGGDRKSFYSNQRGFPFQTEASTFDTTGVERETNRVPLEILTSSDAVLNVFRRNLGYFFFGRHTGFVAYFFPGFAAMMLFLASRGARRTWQWLLLATGLASAVTLLLYMPFTYSGGGGPVGNRYVLGVYPLFLFLTPALARVTSGLVTAAVSAIFVAPLISNPFYTSFHPAEHTKSGAFRSLPIELSLLNDLPVNNTPARVKQPLGGTPPVNAYFLDDNAYQREVDWFWVRGESRADVILRAPAVTEVRAEGDVVRPLQIPRLEVQLESGPVATHVTIKTGVETQSIDLPAHERRSVVVALPRGLPWKYPELPTNYVYAVSIESGSGFIPLFYLGTPDPRFLGVRVRLVPLYE